MNIAFDHGGARILQGNVLDVLAELPADHYHCIVTSPPYWGLRSYLKADDPLKPLELGSEPTPGEYIANQVAVFAEVRRVLHPTGCLFVNIGDTYADGSHGTKTFRRDRQSCQCEPQEPIPCRVLDPFAGTATTLQAALELDCEADGCELNAEYIGYAKQRLSAHLVPKGLAPAMDADTPLFPEAAK